MKKTLTISLFLGIFLLMSTPVINAANPHKLAKTKTSTEILEGQISRNIACPQFLAENTGTNVVRALIEVDNQGKITVDEITSSDDRLTPYVIQQLKGMTVKNIANPEKFVVVVRFVVD